MDKCWAVDLKNPSLIPSQGDFFHLNFFKRGNEPSGEQEQEQHTIRTRTTITQVISWSLADGRRQKYSMAVMEYLSLEEGKDNRPFS